VYTAAAHQLTVLTSITGN